MENDYEPLTEQEMQDESMFMAMKMSFYKPEEVEDAAQDALLAMVKAGQKAKEGMPVRRYQRKCASGAILNFYNKLRHRKSHEFNSLNHFTDCPNTDGTEFIHLIAEEKESSYMERLDATLEAQFLSGIVATLTEIEQKVISLRFYHDKTLTESGEELGITKERVRQIESDALARLRQRYEHPENILEEVEA